MCCRKAISDQVIGLKYIECDAVAYDGSQYGSFTVFILSSYGIFEVRNSKCAEIIFDASSCLGVHVVVCT